MASIHTTGYYFEVENFNNWNNGVSRFYYYQTVNTNEHIYSFSYNGATITPSSNYETIVYKTNQSAWFDYDGSSNPWSLTTTNGVTEGTDNNGIVMMKWGHTGFPDPTISSGGGTSTEEVFVPDAKIVNYGGTTGLRFEQRSYPVASYELIGPVASSTWSLTSQSSNLQHHISNLTAGTYYLWQDSVQVATLIARDKTKVHCNFW